MMIRDESIRNMPLSFHPRQPHDDLIRRRNLPLPSYVIICSTEQLKRRQKNNPNARFNGLPSPSSVNDDLFTACRDQNNKLQENNGIISASDMYNNGLIEIASDGDISDAVAAFHLGGKVAGDTGGSNQLDSTWHTRHVIITSCRREGER